MTFRGENYFESRFLEKAMKKTIGKKLKNQTIIDDLTIQCPAEDFTEKETIAYRWVFDELDDVRNFMPQFLKQPKRFNNKPPKMAMISK